MKHAVYPGSFDPVTNGHLDIVERAIRIFDRLTIAVLTNPQKNPMFSTEDRMDMIREAVKPFHADIQVDAFHGLLVDYTGQIDASVIVRGLRAVSDFEFEFQISLMNRRLCPEIDTIYLMSAAEYTYLSSGLIREIAILGGDVSGLVPAVSARYLKQTASRS